MTEKGSLKIPDSLIMAVMIHVFIAWGLLYLIKIATAHLIYNAYWGILVALLIITPFYWMLSQLVKTYPGLSISMIFSRVFGRILGNSLVIIFFLHIGFFQFIFFRDSQIMVYTYFFKHTPFILVTGVLIAGISYVAWRGVESVGRLALFMLFPPFLVILILQIFGLNNVNPANLRPVFGGSWGDWFMAGTDLITILTPGVGVSIWFSFLKEPKSYKRILIYTLVMVIPLFFLNIMGIVGTFGPKVIDKMGWPVVEYFRLIDSPFLLVEQTGLFFLIAWYPSIFVALSSGAFLLGNEFQIIFPRIKRKWYAMFYCVVLWIGVNLPIGTIASESFFKRSHQWLTISFLSILTITWLVDRLRRFKKTRSL